MPNRWIDKLLPKPKKQLSYLRNMVAGSLYRISDIRGNSSFSDIKTQIDAMRALARDSQVATALSYYATDATLTNSDGQIIWAVPVDKNKKEVAEVINALFKRWEINSYARDHILELATIGNLYIPTTDLYKEPIGNYNRANIALDNNTIPNAEFDIVPSYKIPPEDIVHLFKEGRDEGYILQPDEQTTTYVRYPSSSVIHFSLGGLLGDYTIDAQGKNNDVDTYDIKFAKPFMEQAVQPTQTLGLLEDALLLSSLSRVVRFINVECGNAEEDEQRDTLQMIKDAIEQQLSINTLNGDAQSFVNPQSPNNLIYLPRINGQDPISITDLNMSDATESDSKLLDHYQDKKLSVLGVPKEAMNFSSNEGLGGAGSVLSQRSALYANSLQRLETAYISGWTDAINKYFEARNMNGFVDQFKLQMQPIVTNMSTVVSEKRDASVSQAQSLIDLLKNLGVTDKEPYMKAVQEALKETFPQLGSETMTWNIDVKESEGGDSGF
nr:MAG TPA: capsid assembly protein [Caudoviricetes sp.]